MVLPARPSRSEIALLWFTIFLYVVGRICQLYADRLPAILIMLLHVIPPAVFALVHGRTLYGTKGIATFTACCLGIGCIAESISLITGFPFGHYHFTAAMGPKLFNVPILLALAYLGIGYVSWILAVLILGYRDLPIRGTRLVSTPLLAGLIMLAWDIAMDPDWSTVDHIWVWHSGGAYFGVPLSNFGGWFLTAFLYYLAFALYCKMRPISSQPTSQVFWGLPILLYATCALGNLLILQQPMAPPIVFDAAGKQWHTGDILVSCILISLLVMTPLALLAWLRLREILSS
jgi:uncharacterized membrane protein